MSQYNKTYGSGGWVDEPVETTPESAAAFNHMEQGIATRVGSVNGVDPDATGNVVVATGGGSGTVTSVGVTDTSLAVAGTAGAPTLAINASGTRDGTKFLRDDRTWAVPAGGGSGYNAVTDGNFDTFPARAQLQFVNGFAVNDNTPYTQVNAVPAFDVDTVSGAVTRIHNAFDNFVNNARFDLWSLVTLLPLSWNQINAVVAQVAGLVTGTFAAQVTFSGAFTEVSQTIQGFAAGDWVTVSAQVERVSGAGAVRLLFIRDGFPFGTYGGINPLSVTAGSGPQWVMFSCQVTNTEACRVQFQCTDAAGSVWKLHRFKVQRGQNLANEWSPSVADQVAALTTLPAAVSLPAGSILGSTLPIYSVPTTGYSKIVVTADTTVCFVETDGNSINEFHLIIEQDATGGHNVIFSPRTIAWSGGVEPKIDMAPHTTTYIRGQWLGINYGMAAEVIPMSWYKRRLPNVYNGVTLGIGIDVMRGTSEATIRFAVNWLNRYSNLTHRTTLGNNGAVLQYSDAWSQDCPLAGNLRGSAYQFYYGFTVTGGSVIRSGPVPFGDGTGHEYYHAEHNYYFYPTYTDTGGGAYAPYNGLSYQLLNHPVTRDCWYRAYNAVSTRTISCNTTSGSAIVTTAGAFLVPGAQTYSDVSGSCPTAGISGTGIAAPTRTLSATTALGMGEFTFAAGAITNADIGSIVTGTGIPANTGIVAMGSVANPNSTTTAILSRMATASGTITLTIQNQIRVASVQSSTQLTMSAPATATQSGVTLTITWATGNGSNLAEWWAQTRQVKKMIDAGDSAIIDTKLHVAGGDATVVTDFENFIAHLGIVGG